MEKTREILFRGFHECQKEDAEENFAGSQFTEILIIGSKWNCPKSLLGKGSL
jgi:hypothetical protein